MISHERRAIHQETVPVIESNIFADKEIRDKIFATAMLGFGLYPENVDESIFRAYLQLRKNVYVDQQGFLTKDSVLSDGTEADEYDDYSEHIAILRNLDLGRVAVEGCIRVITKRTEDNVLPVEHIYPEIFEDSPVPIGGVEVSRFISQAGSMLQKMRVHGELFLRSAAYFDRNALGPTYAVVDPSVRKALPMLGAPVAEVLSFKQEVDRYNGTENEAIRIDDVAMVEGLKKKIGEDKFNNIILTPGSITYWGERK